MSFKLIKSLDDSEWNKFVLSSPQGNLFCKTEFLEASKQSYDAYFVKKNELILLGVLIIKNTSEISINVPYIYQGLLFSEYIESLSFHKKCKVSLEIIEFLLREMEALYETISLSLHHSFNDLRGIQWHNYDDKKRPQANLKLNYTGILKIDNKVVSFDKILSDVRTSRRQEYRKCLNNGFVVEESTDLSILDSLHAKTFARQGVSRSNGEIFMVTELAKNSLSKGFGKILVCKDHKGTVASASLFLFDDKTAYYLIGANDPQYRKDGVGSYLMLEQIRDFMDQGLSYIDFVGINSPLRGDYKTSFNASPLAYYSFTMKM